jgi:hypothetical protein
MHIAWVMSPQFSIGSVSVEVTVFKLTVPSKRNNVCLKPLFTLFSNTHFLALEKYKLPRGSFHDNF